MRVECVGASSKKTALLFLKDKFAPQKQGMRVDGAFNTHHDTRYIAGGAVFFLSVCYVSATILLYRCEA